MAFQIDPSRGSEAAADMADDEFQLLVRIVMWELAVRTSPEHFEGHLRNIAALRADIEDEIVATRGAREQRRFAAAVMEDIASLPGTDDHPTELNTGLYL